MIVVVAFMQGFQQKFRSDIIDAQGHARAVPQQRQIAWRDDVEKMESQKECKSFSLHARSSAGSEQRLTCGSFFHGNRTFASKRSFAAQSISQRRIHSNSRT